MQNNFNNENNKNASNYNLNNNNNNEPSQKLYYRESEFFTTNGTVGRRASEQQLSPRVSNSYFTENSNFLTHSTSCDQSINFVPVSLILEGEGPPWGFSLKGGREHNKPIVVTK